MPDSEHPTEFSAKLQDVVVAALARAGVLGATGGLLFCVAAAVERAVCDMPDDSPVEDIVAVVSDVIGMAASATACAYMARLDSLLAIPELTAEWRMRPRMLLMAWILSEISHCTLLMLPTATAAEEEPDHVEP